MTRNPVAARRAAAAALALLLAPAARAANEEPGAAPDAASAQAATTPPPAPPPDFWHRDTLTGDWGGARDRFGDHGFEPFASLTAEAWDNTRGGVTTGATADMLFSFGFDADFEKMLGWTGGGMHAQLNWVQGRGINTTKIRALNGPTNIEASDQFRVFTLYLEQKLWAHQITLRGGMIAADQEFWQSDIAGLFLNAGITAPAPLYSQVLRNGNNATAQYPLAVPGGYVKYEPKGLPVYVKGTVLLGNPGPDISSNHGFEFSGDGELMVGEAGWHYTFSGRPGKLKAGGFYHTGTFTNWNTLAAERDLYGAYGMLEQTILQTPGAAGSDPTPILTAYVYGGWAGPDSRATASWDFGAGLNWHGPIPGRDNDVAGIAVLYTGMSSGFTRAAGGLPTAAETDLEVTYLIQVTPWFALQPDFQVIFNPVASLSRQTAIVVGARAVVTF